MRANSSGIFNRVVRLLNIAAMLCIGTTAYSQRTVPDSYPEGTPVNYIKTWDAAAPDPDGNYITQRPLKDVKLTTQYIDGLGRPFQTVARKGSLETGPGMLPKDMVVMQQYDELGREAFKYLPYAETTGNDGTFKTDPFTKQAAFMNATYGTGIQNETWYYAQTEFEASPLNRPVKQMAAGNSWVGAARGVVTKYWNNTATDAVKKWEINTDINELPTFPVGTSSGSYNAGELIKTITEDEHGKQVIEFKDRDGKVILKKVQLTATADDGTGRDYTGWLCTYYLYDIYNNLRCVVQPKGVELLNDNLWNLNALSGTILAEQCFQYGYDGRNRMTVKKVPGAGEVYMVYDNRDRLVATSDANGRSGAYTGYCYWLFTLYDELNRPVATGEMHSCMNFTGMQSYVNGLNNGSVTFNTQPGTAMSLTAWNPVVGNSICSACSNWYIGTLTHYDDYTGLPSGLSSFLTTWNTHFDATNNTAWPYPQLVTAASTATKGMVTWTSSRILGTANFLNTVNYYDEKGRVIQVQSTNITGGTDVVTTQYSWAGQPLVSVQKQTHAISGKTIVIVSKNTYDDLGRLVKTDKKQSHTDVALGAMSDYKTNVTLEYDQLGQLKKKSLGNKVVNPVSDPPATAPVETLTYDYNIRGWMLGANRAYARDDNNDHYFGFDLGYDKMANNLINGQVYNAAQYNGNITGMVWKSKGDGEKRKYDFGYDAANRLLKGDFTQYSGTVFDQTGGVNYDIKMGDGATASSAYDANGNIKQMQQWGLKLNNSTQVDNLGYQYIANSNKLLSVTEATLGTTDNKLGDFTDKNTTNDDYSYDENGNLTLDKNKSISSITYNHLNLPSVITVTGKGTITYTYDAAGNKLRKTTVETNVSIAPYNGTTVTSTTDYIGGFIYESKHYSTLVINNDLGYTNKLQFTGHEEGRIRPTYTEGVTADAYVLNGFVYDYMIKDHLGNVRMVLTEEQKTDKYPVASLEDSKIATEKQYYDIQDAYVRPKSEATGITAYVNDNGIGNNPGDPTFEATNSDKVYRLNSNANKTGLGITLKVMAGDKIDVFGKSYYFQNNPGSGYNNYLGLIDVLNGFLGNPLAGGATGAHGIVTGTDINTTPGTAVISTLFGNQTTQNSSAPLKPRAFINVIFFDEQFKATDYRASIVGANSTVKDHYTDLQNLTAPKNGYVYIYCSNETPVNVFFDNLQVQHTRGALLEETHYYPFGLVMSGISSKAAGMIPNRKKFNDGTELQSGEFSDGSGLELYATDFRSYDPQIGRLWQIDPLAEITDGISPYAYCSNNPILLNDPTGLLGDTTVNGVYYPDNKTLNEVVVTSKPNTVNKAVDETNKWLGWTGLGWGAYEANKQYRYLGDWMYRNSAGTAQSIFDTKWGSNKTPENLGNLKNYSKNARAAIRNTKAVKVLKIGGKIFIVVGTTLDALKVINAYANNDPKAGEYARKAALNTSVALGSAAIPVVGWMVGGVYFLGDALIPKDANGVGGWERGMEASRQNVENNREIDPTWSPRPMGGLQ